MGVVILNEREGTPTDLDDPHGNVVIEELFVFGFDGR
jgi:hypothetical protein